MLLPVPMEGLSSCPAFAIGLENAMHFPIGPISDQYLARFLSPLAVPQHHDPHRMRDLGQADGLGKVPLGALTNCDLLAASGQEVARNPVAGFPLAPLD